MKEIEQKYEVEIVEIVSKTIEVKAKSMDSAKNKVKELYQKEEIELRKENRIDLQFNVTGPMLEILVIYPNQKPFSLTIVDATVEIENIVEGNIEIAKVFDDGVTLLSNKEGLLMELPFNRVIYSQCGNIENVILGNFVLCRQIKEQIHSLTLDDIDRYKRMFKYKESLILEGQSVYIKKKDK